MLKLLILYYIISMNNDKIPIDKNKLNQTADKIDIKKYSDPIGLSAKNLDLGLWLAGHKRIIIRTIIIILFAIAASFILYAAYGYFYYFSFGREQQMILDQSNFGVDLVNYRLQNIAKPLEVLTVKVLNNRNGYDFIAKVKNPNSKHYASLNYCFTFDGGEKCATSFILPGEEKNIILFNQVITGVVNNVSFKTSDILWQKLNAGNIANWDVYKGERLSFATSDVVAPTYDGGLDYLEFTLSNNSAYAYYEVPLNITVENNGEIVAVNRYTAQDVNSREQKSIRLYWPGITTLGGTINIVPELNIIDSSIYKPYRSN